MAFSLPTQDILEGRHPTPAAACSAHNLFFFVLPSSSFAFGLIWRVISCRGLPEKVSVCVCECLGLSHTLLVITHYQHRARGFLHVLLANNRCGCSSIGPTGVSTAGG